jgi:uncharacterized protein
MNEEEMRTILRGTKTIAVVGMSSRPGRLSEEVPRYLMACGYKIIPVNPNITEVLGEKAYPDLASIGEPVDLVDIFLHPDQVMPVVDQAIQIGARVVWMQEGIVNDEAAERAQGAGLSVIQDMCIRSVHRFLFGGADEPAKVA